MTTPTGTDGQQAAALCVLGCADRSRTDVWPRPPRPRADGLVTCRSCADRIRDTLAEVLELAVNLELVAAAGSVPSSGGGRKRIKDEPVAPVPVRVNVTALTDVRSRRGTWVPDAPPPPPATIVGSDDSIPYSLEQLRAAVDRDSRFLTQMVWRFGPTSGVARTAAAWLDGSQYRLRAATGRRPAGARSIDGRDNEPTSVVGFLDHWTDRVRVGRRMLGAGPCTAHIIDWIELATGPFGSIQLWSRTVVCGRPTEYRRLVRFDAGARTTGLFAVCPARHVTRPPGQGHQQLAQRGGHGHRPTSGARHGLTIFSAIGLLRTHNDWVCSQPWVVDYWKALRELRTELGRAHGEPRPSRIGVCPNGTGQVDENGKEIECGTPLAASPYSDSIECPKCGRVWTHREWRFLGRQLGVIA